MMSTQITIEISAEKPNGNGVFTAMLDLPATRLQIEDVKDQARYSDRPKRYQSISIYESTGISLENVRLDTTSIEELNFLAKRLDSMSRYEKDGFEALTEKYYSQMEEDDLISVKELINLTYNLDTLRMVPNITDLEELGRFAVENDFVDDLLDAPDSALKYLDYELIGQEQLDRDEGVFVGNHYVVTEGYEPVEVYDGENLPQEDDSEKTVFRLLVAKAPIEDPSEVLDDAMWLDLPVASHKLRWFAEELGADSIQDCIYFDFQSCIPDIDEDVFNSMSRIEELNRIASEYLMLSQPYRALVKAIIEGENLTDLSDIRAAFERRDQYEFSSEVENADEFLREYLTYQMPTDFDDRWLSQVTSHEDAQKLVTALGAHITEYGVLSARGGTLFEKVRYPDLYSEIINPDEYELIEIIGRPALFVDGRISADETPDGLYCYDLRYGEEGLIDGVIEPKVSFDHGGSILVKEPIEFGESDFIQLDEDSSPNFIGDEMTAEEFMARDFSEDSGESFDQTGGMSL